MSKAQEYERLGYKELEELKHAVFRWYVSPVSDDEAYWKLYDAASAYAYAIYGDLSESDRWAEYHYMKWHGQ